MRKEPGFWLVLALFAFVVLLAAFGCAPTRKSCEDNYGPCGVPVIEERIRDRIVEVSVPGAVVYDTITLAGDTVLLPGQERVVSDPTQRARLTWYMNEYGVLKAKCEALPDTVEIQVTDTIRVETKVQQPPSNTREFTWNGMLVGLVIGAAIMLAVWGIPKIIRLIRLI